MEAAFTIDPLLDIVRTLAGSELDNAKIGEAVLVEGIFVDDRFDLRPTVANRQDDPAVSRYFPAGDQKISRRIVFLQELHVGRHVRVDGAKVGFVDQLDNEHDAGATNVYSTDFPASLR